MKKDVPLLSLPASTGVPPYPLTRVSPSPEGAAPRQQPSADSAYDRPR